MTVTVHQRLPAGKIILKIERRGRAVFVPCLTFSRTLAYSYEAPTSQADQQKES